MFRLQRCILSIGLALFAGGAARATPPLTVVQDILFNTDGTRFNGIATISWPSFQASDGSNIAAHSVTTRIISGLLRVQLVPTMNALSAASYTVVYNGDGNTTFTEHWAIPASNVPLRVRDVRIGGAGSIVGGGGSGGVGNDTNAIGIADVTGLSAALTLRPTIGTGYTVSRAAVIDATGSLESATGNSGDCVHVDGTSGPCSGGTNTAAGPTFVDGEIPSGAINGSNTSFTLGNAPNPASSLALYRNGLLLRNVNDYTVSGVQVTFTAGSVPQTNDNLIASYRLGANATSVVFVDAETPAGAVDGSNLTFTLAQNPNPVGSLALFRNGLRLRGGLDYAVSGNSIVFTSATVPQSGDVLLAWYRH